MPRIAVIQDGTELARQTDADITGCFERCCELLSADGPRFTAGVYTDEAVGPLLARIDRREHRCLVIASNALNSGTIERELERRRPALQGYLGGGGGLVVLHQASTSLASVLPGELCPDLVDRRAGPDVGRATAADPDDVLLRYPMAVALDRFVDGGFDVGPPSLFYKALRPESLSADVKPVLVCGAEVLVARTYDHVPERVVIATLPLDWQRATELLSNAIRFACLGRPRRLVWREGGAAQGALLVQWLASDDASSIRVVPAADRDLSPPERWLLANVDVAVVAAAHVDAIQSRAPVQAFLAQGGTLLSADDESGHPASHITALVGGHLERRLASRLYGELRAVEGWMAADYAFELRNIVTALAFLWTGPANRTDAAVGPHELAALGSDLRDRLRDPRHREDLSSSIAHVQSLALLSDDRPLAADLYEWMGDDPRQRRPDVGLQVRAVTALARRRPDPGLPAAALEAVGDPDASPSLAGVVRVLDAIAVVDQAGLLEATPTAIKDLTAALCSTLERAGAEPGVGWLAVEATADVARGLLALASRLPGDQPDLAARVADLVGAGVGVLRRALPGYERDRKSVAWLARVTHALVLADRQFPIALQRLATLEWPDQAGVESVTDVTGQSLLERLAGENKALRDRQRQLEEERLAARVGRATATLGAAAIVAAPFAYLVALVGFESVWSLLGNVTVLATMLLGIVAGVFTLLDRSHLLARPAMRVHSWISEAVPALSVVARLRR